MTSLFTGATNAQELRLESSMVLSPFEPSYIAPNIDLPIYAEPPAGFFNLPGDIVGHTQSGVPYGILDDREVGSIGGSAIWIEVAPIQNGVISGEDAVWLPYDAATAGPLRPISGLME
ncbi:hypothetical protein V8J82_10585 [Gymnodinialimonas sp. 2305UL16-5]|uniref:hypothetical protein n=1 Tax=Gymnodinialimonas mytili TaxID=3126503 RepID=UPI00309C39DE